MILFSDVRTVFNILFLFLADFSSYSFCDHAGFKSVGDSDSPPLPEDGCKG